MRFVNADEIKVKEKLSSVAAGKKALLSIDELISKKTSFSFETTMSGLGLRKRFYQLKKNNYEIVILYLFAYPTELFIERIIERVKKGGHLVEDNDVIRRYYRSLLNFWNIYKNYADEWAIVNNNEFQYKNIVVGNNNIINIIDICEFEKFKEALQYAKTCK